MGVSMDGLRLQLMAAYNELVATLNRNIEECDDDGVPEYISVKVGHIERSVNDLRSLIWSLACCYDEKQEEFSMLAIDDRRLVALVGSDEGDDE